MMVIEVIQLRWYEAPANETWLAQTPIGEYRVNRNKWFKPGSHKGSQAANNAEARRAAASYHNDLVLQLLEPYTSQTALEGELEIQKEILGSVRAQNTELRTTLSSIRKIINHAVGPE